MEDERSGHEQGWVRIRVHGGVERARGEGDVRRLLDEASELADRHGPLVDPEALDLDAPDRRFLRIEVLRTHREVPARYPRHSVQQRRRADRGHAPTFARRRVHGIAPYG